MNRENTDKQEKTLAFLRDRNNWRPPTLNAIAKQAGYSSRQSAKDALVALHKRGLLKRIFPPIPVDESGTALEIDISGTNF